jgi:hypothetical protein
VLLFERRPLILIILSVYVPILASGNWGVVSTAVCNILCTSTAVMGLGGRFWMGIEGWCRSGIDMRRCDFSPPGSGETSDVTS